MDQDLYYSKILKNKRVNFRCYKKGIIKIHNYVELGKKDIKMVISILDNFEIMFFKGVDCL